jgi:hypothetical protein
LTRFEKVAIVNSPKVGGLLLEGGGGVFVVDVGAPVAEAIGAERLVEGLVSSGGYVAGALATGEAIDLKDLGLAFAAGAGIPGGSGTGWKKILTGAGWGMVSNASQSAASQGIDVIVTGDPSHFAPDELAVNAALGGVGGPLGDLFGDTAEQFMRGLGRGIAEAAGEYFGPIASDALLSLMEALFVSPN